MEPIDPNDRGPVGPHGGWDGPPPAYYRPSYPPPAYAHAGHPSPTYPQPVYPPMQFGQVGTAPVLYPEPPKRNRPLIVALSLVGVLGAAAIAVAIVAAGHSTPKAGPPLPIPPSISQFQQRKDALLDRFKASFQRQAAGQASEVARFFTKGQLAVYTSGTGTVTPTLVMIVGRSSAYPQIASAGLNGQAFIGLGGPSTFDAGDHGGKLECAQAPVSDENESVCVWSDQTSVGMMISADVDGPLQGLADLTNEARATVDS